MILEQLVLDLKKSGFTSTDTVLMHSSCKAIGYDANDILDTLMEFFKDGLLLLPTHTWNQDPRVNNIFDVENSVACVGILPNLFRRREGVIRSLHPTHSVAGYGKYAKDFLKGEEHYETPCAPGGVYDRLRSRDAKILLVGVGNERNTFIHGVEELLDVPNRINSTGYPWIIRTKNGDIPARMHGHYNPQNPHISDDFVKLDDAFYALGVMKDGSFGYAKTKIVDTNKAYRLIQHILSYELEGILTLDSIPEKYWKDYKEEEQ